MTDYYNPNEKEIRERIQGLQEFDEWNRRALMTVWSLFGKPRTYLDIGSGSGAMVNFARDCQVDAIGVDVIAQSPDIKHDLREPLILNRNFELVTSIETAEHVEPEYMSIFVDSIANHMDAGSIFGFYGRFAWSTRTPSC